MFLELLKGRYRCRCQITQCFEQSLSVVFILQISKLILRVFLIDLRKHDQIIIVLQSMHQQPEEGDQIKLQQQEYNRQPQPGSLGYQQIMQDLAEGPNDSIEQKLPSEMMQQQQQDDVQGHIRRLNSKTQQLHADEQFLKQELKVREKETLQTFSTLMAKKKELVKLIQSSFNRKSSKLDIALTEQFEQMRKIILGQEAKLEQLHSQIRKQGLAGVLGDQSSVKIKNKTQQMQKQIKVGRKFSSTQYVRDYLQRPQAYKVSYQQAKYEYELRLRVKQCLQQQKLLYQKKKEELNLAKKKQRERQQQLHKQLDYLKS